MITVGPWYRIIILKGFCKRVIPVYLFLGLKIQISSCSPYFSIQTGEPILRSKGLVSSNTQLKPKTEVMCVCF